MKYYWLFLLIEYIYFVVKNKYIYANVYLLGILFNSLFIFLLKHVVLSPKPFIDSYLFHIEYTQNKQVMTNQLGMPSLKTSLFFYSLFFFYFVFSFSYLLLFIGIFYLIICCYYWKEKQNSFLQLFVGSIIGISFSFFFFYLGNTYLIGELKNNNLHELWIL
jgi:hypothetical protein